MSHDISQPVPQGGNGAQDAENSRIAAIANELDRLCAIHEAQLRDSQADVSHFEVEQRAAEQMAKAGGYWIPMMDIFDLGVPGPSGNENDTYVADNIIYKVNNLLNSGSIVALLKKILMHNLLFPDTAYSFYGFAGFDGRMSQGDRPLVSFFSFLFVYSEIMFNFAAEIKWIAIMDIKKITHEEALRRWKHSLEIKREWERKVAERWANEDQQKIALV